MKFTACSTPSSGLLAATLALLAVIAQASDDVNAAGTPRMQRLTRKSAVEPAPFARRATLNATTDSHVGRQDKVASTVSNSTSSSSASTTSGKSNTETVGELVNKHLGSSPYNVAQALQLLSDGTSSKKQNSSDETETSSTDSPALVGVKANSDSSNNSTSVAHLNLGSAIGIVNPNSKLKQIVKADHVRRGDDDDEQDADEDEDCEADDDDDGEECEEDEDENNDEECEEDDDEDSEECEEDGDNDDEDDEECEEDGDDDEADAPARQALDAAKNYASTKGGDEASGSTPSNLAEGSLSADKGCTKFAVAESGDSCYKLIGTKDDATLQAFYKNNPNVDSECQNLAIGASYCVASSA